MQVVGQRSAGRHAASLQLGVGNFAILVRVERLPRLECRNLGLVNDEIEGDAVGFDPEPGVVVDREIAERMGQHDRRQEEPREDRQREGASGRTHQSSSRTVVRAVWTASGSKLGSVASASSR